MVMLLMLQQELHVSWSLSSGRLIIGCWTPELGLMRTIVATRIHRVEVLACVVGSRFFLSSLVERACVLELCQTISSQFQYQYVLLSRPIDRSDP